MQVILSILVWLYWTVCFVAFFFIVTILYVVSYPFDRFHQIPNRALKGLAQSLMIPVPGWKVAIRGADLAKISKPTLVVANHQSFLDMPLLYLLPWSMKWVAKKSLFRIPVFGWIVYMTGHLGIDRESRRSVKMLDELVTPIQEGIPGMIFPEGTRSPDGDLKAFKNGAFVLAERYNFRLLPVVLNGGHRAMKPGSWKFNLRQLLTVSVLEPLNPNDFASVYDLKERVHDLIADELQAICSEDTYSKD